MSTKTEICNLALAHLGVGKPITDLDTDDSAEAEVLRRFYDITRKQVLRDFDWSFAAAFVTLEETDTAPTTEWAYAYALPDDCLKFRRLLSGLRVDTRDTKQPYRLVRGPGSTFEIYTDLADAVAEITVDFVTKTSELTSISAVSSGIQTIVADDAIFNDMDLGRTLTISGDATSANNVTATITEVVSSTSVKYANSGGSASASSVGTVTIDESVRFPADFIMAMSLRMAINISPRVTAGDNGLLMQRLYQMYDAELGRARANASNEAGTDLEPQSEFIRARS